VTQDLGVPAALQLFGPGGLFPTPYQLRDVESGGAPVATSWTTSPSEGVFAGSNLAKTSPSNYREHRKQYRRPCHEGEETRHRDPALDRDRVDH
jgi:hypothetical protein